MIRVPLTYEDLFTEEEITKDFWFHLNKIEMLELSAGGFKELMQRIIDTNNEKLLIKEFQVILLAAYGERQEDSFVKNDAIRERFKNHPAFETLFMKLVTDADWAGDFILGLVPKEMAVETRTEMEALRAQGKAEEKKAEQPSTPATTTPPAHNV